MLLKHTRYAMIGEVCYDTRETFYHVMVPGRGWIAEVKSFDVDTPEVLSYTHEQPYAHIFSREGARAQAYLSGGKVWRVTRTGKVQEMRD